MLERADRWNSGRAARPGDHDGDRVPRDNQGATMKRKIEFTRDDLTLVGNLFTPEGFDENGKYNAVVVEGSFSSVKEQMAGTYAEKFAEQGFVALAFDYAHYGESAGEPRQLESPSEKLTDLQAAVSYLEGLPYVQAVGMVGVCTSAGNAAYLGAAEPRIKALATVAAFLPGPAVFSLLTAATRELPNASRPPPTPDASTRRPARPSSSPPTARPTQPPSTTARPGPSTTTSTRPAATSPSTATRRP